MNAKRTVPPAEVEAHPLETLLNEVEKLNVTPAAKEKFMQVLRRMAGERVTFKRSLLIKPVQVNLTMRLLDDGLSVAEVREALCVRTGISRNCAYGLITAALNQRVCQRQIGLLADAYGESENHG